jgi:hypothetical protein
MEVDRPWLEQSEVTAADINLTQEDADALAHSCVPAGEAHSQR